MRITLWLKQYQSLSTDTTTIFNTINTFVCLFVFYITHNLILLYLHLTFAYLVSVLVALYEQPERPSNALEYPFTHIKLFLTLLRNCMVGSELST